MSRLTPRNSAWASGAGVALYLAITGVVIGWLAMHGAETRQRRLDAAPHVTETFGAPESAAVPRSWTEKPHADAGTEVQTAQPSHTEAPVAAQMTQHPTTEAPHDAPALDGHANAPSPVAAPTVVGTQKWRERARPFVADKRPRIIVVVDQLGLSAEMLSQASALPGDVTLSLLAGTPNLQQVASDMHALGHEVLLSIPMEPRDFPRNDPGDNALLTGLPDGENIARLQKILDASGEYVGVMPLMGEKFLRSQAKLTPVLQKIGQQGLLFFDTSLAQNDATGPIARFLKLPFVRAERRIDIAVDGMPIDTQLAQVEKTARDNGHVVVVITPYPLVLEALKSWAASLAAKNIVLAPLTAGMQD